MKKFSKLAIVAFLSIIPFFVKAQNSISPEDYFFKNIKYSSEERDTLKYKEYLFKKDFEGEIVNNLRLYKKYLDLYGGYLNNPLLIEQAFERIDSDGDKSLSLEEIRNSSNSLVGYIKGIEFRIYKDL